jgi:prevent-host-death family protein
MKFITVTELKNRATQIVSEIDKTKEQVAVTKNGKPVVVIQIVSDCDFLLKEENQKRKGVKKHGNKRTV